ncbi:hypothetical protein DFH28DRAFT_1163510 [Melampsora americana]|nr:hypothetical protein DFH28DRAFT_1163510 [Melampsora americana]
MVRSRKPKKRDSNVLADLGTRPSFKKRVESPPRQPPLIPQSISDALGIGPSRTNDQQNIYDGSIYDDLNEDPIAVQFLPHRDEAEAEADPPPIPIAGTQFAEESQQYWNAEARQHLRNQWSAIESQMTATYLECQHETDNWTSRESYLDDVINCDCSGQQLSVQAVDLINLSSYLSKFTVTFCSCMPRPVRLLRYGYIASSPQYPQTAFSIPTLQFYHELWNMTASSNSGFIGALMRFVKLRSIRRNTNLQNPPQAKNNPAKSLIHDRDMRRQFSHSVHMYRATMRCTKRIYSEGLKLSNSQLLADKSRKPKKRDSNVLADLGTRPSFKKRVESPPRQPPLIPQSISDALGIGPSRTNDQQNIYDGSIYDDLNEDPIAVQFLPHRDEAEAEADPPPIPIAGTQFAEESQQYWNAEARQHLRNQWSAIESQMTATYLECQHETDNWTSRESYLDDVINCDCSGQQLSVQAVDLINLSSYLSKFTVTFCSCMPRPVRLLRYGYIASSPQYPQTAFSIPTLQFYHELWNMTASSNSGFIGALMRFVKLRSIRRNTNLQNPPQAKNNPAKSLIHDRDMRRQFSHSVHMYRATMRCTKRIYSEGLKLSNSQLLADKCARCFGPAINEKRTSPQEPHVIIALDGNFQHRHYTKSSKDNPTEEEYPDMFIKPSSMKKHEIIQISTDAEAKNIKNACADSHTAANDVRNSTSWKRSDDTGLFGCTCRHDVPLKLANIYKTGEKLYYPVTILEQLLLDLPDIQVGVLYDIGCQLETHIKKRRFLEALSKRLSFGTSVFHAYVHNWACQVLYNPRFNAFWGLTDGEGLERFWSFLAVLVAINRISTPLHRMLNINWRADFFVEITLETTAKWLLRRLRNAHTVSLEARRALTKLLGKRSSQFPNIRYTDEFLRQQWSLERSSQQKRCHIKEEQKVELGRLLYYEQMAKDVWDLDAGDVTEGFSRLNQLNSIKKKIEKQRAKIDHVWNEAHEQDQILKIWYTKQEVRDQFLAICEQKAPLDMSRRDGKHSSVGHNDKTHVIKALRDQSAKLKTKLETYQKMVEAYATSSPNRIQPTSITYPELLKIDFDHPFWNDGLFTNGREPWAIDADTQHGMRQVAYYDRACEEVRRIGWETHNNIEADAALIIDLPLTDHPMLASLRTSGKISAAQIIINEKLVKIMNLQVDWNTGLLEVFKDTPPQDGDGQLRTDWCDQIKKIQHMYSRDLISWNPGIITTVGENIQMDNQKEDVRFPVPESFVDCIVEGEGDFDEFPSDGEIDMEEEDIDEALM